MIPAMMPVDLPVLVAFLGAVSLLVLSPGPDTMLILRYTIGSGRGSGLATVAGVQAGLLIHTAAAVIGLSILIAANPVALKVIAVIGALYLAWLGWQSFRAGTMAVGPATGDLVAPTKAFRDALFTNLFNPKVVLLFFALMPQFVRNNGWPVPMQLGLLGVSLILINALWQTTITLLADGIRLWLARPATQRAVSWATGAVLIAFALLMVADFLLPR